MIGVGLNKNVEEAERAKWRPGRRAEGKHRGETETSPCFISWRALTRTTWVPLRETSPNHHVQSHFSPLFNYRGEI